MDDKTLASELLHEIKQNAKRWFVAFCVMIAIEIATIAGFLWYVSLPIETEEVQYEQTIEDVQDTKATQVMGGIYNGTDETDSEKAAH